MRDTKEVPHARGKKAQTIQKDKFPSLLKQLMDSLESNTKANLQAGFRKTGIFPTDPEPVLNRLPRTADDDERANTSVSDVFIAHLQEMRFGTEEEAAPRRKKRRLDVEPGKSVRGPVENDGAADAEMEPPSADEQEEVPNSPDRADEPAEEDSEDISDTDEEWVPNRKQGSRANIFDMFSQ